MFEAIAIIIVNGAFNALCFYLGAKLSKHEEIFKKEIKGDFGVEEEVEEEKSITYSFDE